MANQTFVEPHDFLAGGDEMGALMRSFDWEQTPLGPPQHWPQGLKTCVRILLTSRQPMFVWWGEQLINLYNDAYKQIVGGKHPQALGQPAALVWQEIWDQVGPRAESAMRQNEGTYDEALQLIMERHGYKEETYYTFSYSPVPDDNGAPGGILCANTDDTRRILGERQLQLLSALGAAVAHTGSWREACHCAARAFASNTADMPFALIYLDDELVACSGISPDHPAAQRFAWPLPGPGESPEVCEILPPNLPQGPWPEPPQRAAMLPIQVSSARHGTLVVGLNPYRLYDESYRNFLALVAGQLSAALGSAQAFEEEKQRSTALAELDRAKTAFFSNVSHEFRTPLTLILGPLETLLEQPLPPEQLGELQVMHRNSLRLLKLVNNLLDFSRIEAGRVEAFYEPVDLSVLTVDLASVFRSACERAGLQLVLDCPPLRQPVYVDRDMWEKIVLNLISNAFKYTFSGSIKVSLKPAGDHVRLSVTDTGTGIPEEAQSRLFERFYRVEGARGRSQEGSGIGLALVAELARLHGGQVSVQSREGEGSTFSVSLPFGREHLPPERIEAALTLSSTATRAEAFLEEALRWLPEVAEAAPEPVRAIQGRVLIADDNTDMREYLARLLEESWEVETVSDGCAAFESVRRNPPDVLLTDVMMPGLNGFELVQKIRSDSRLSGVPIIMLSARAGEEARLEGLQSGADDYLIKPFSARELQVRVTSVVSLARVRREAREREAELKAEWAQVLESISQAFVAVDRDFRFVYVNREAEFFCGKKREEMVGLTLWELFPSIVGTELERRYRQAMETQETTSFEYYSSVQERWFAIDVHAGRYGGLAIYFRDISVHKRDEAVLSAQREALEQALNGAELSHILGCLTAAVCQHSQGQSVASVLLLDETSGTLRLGAAPDLPARYREVAQQVPIGPHNGSCGAAAYTGQPVIAEDLLTHPNWTKSTWVVTEFGFRACWSVPILTAQGRVLGTFAIYRRKVGRPRPEDLRTVELLSRTAALVLERGRDISARRQAESERELLLESERAARNEAERTSRLKDEFLATLSHELRTPLNAILGWSQMLRRQTSDPDMLEGLEVIERNSRVQTQLIEDLLDMSRIISGKMRLEVQTVHLQEVLRAAVLSVQPAAQAKDIRLQTTLDPEVGAVRADPARLQQCFWNLVSNAVKFTPRGGQVEIVLRRVHGHVEVCVSDTGIGIKPEFLPFIFDRFRQADASTTRSHGGLGLGLAIVRNLVELHGGRIWASSGGEGQGSTFVLELPLLLATASSEASEARHLRATPAAAMLDLPDLSDVSVLVVEDEEDTRELVCRVLEECGAEVWAASSAEEALQALQRVQPGMLLSDIGMPIGDVYEFIRQVRSLPHERGGSIPAVALTAFARAEDRTRALLAGYHSHLSKPVDPMELAMVVARLAQRRQPPPG